MRKNGISKILCPCCGKIMLEEYAVCPFCNWENDPVQNDMPDYPGGANKMSLNEAREIYNKTGKIVQ